MAGDQNKFSRTRVCKIKGCVNAKGTRCPNIRMFK